MHGEQTHCANRHVDQENPVPCKRFDEPAAKRRSEDRADLSAIEMTASAETYASPVTLRSTASRPMGSSMEPPIPWITRATIS